MAERIYNVKKSVYVHVYVVLVVAVKATGGPGGPLLRVFFFFFKQILKPVEASLPPL